ncbi:MAG TPA: glycosyltransferase family 39 protein [Iamia sp.]
MEDVAPRPRREVVLLGLTVALVGLVFLVAVSPWAGRDPGYSLDGFNASVWGLGARAAADDPIGSRLGGVQPDGDRYANHPPLTVWTAAVGDAVSGGRSWAVRGPAVLASLAALVALAVLLADARMRWEAVAAGVVVMGTTGMFLTYGAMLDTPVVSLPFGLLALVVAQRAWQGRPPSIPLVVAAGALAALSGWQAAVAASLAAAVCAFGPGARAPARRPAVALATGVGLGGAVTVGWILAVQRSLRPLLDQAGNRTSRTETDVSWYRAIGTHLADLYGPTPLLVVLVLAVVAGLALPRRDPGRDGPRLVLAIVAVTVVGYSLAFRNGAAVHDYWTYWATALFGVGAAAAAQGVLDRGRGTLARVGALALVAGLVGSVAVAGLVRQPDAETHIRDGLLVAELLDRVPDAEEPTAVALAVYGSPGELPWAEIAVHGRAVAVDDPADLGALPPDLPVLVILRGPPSPQLREVARIADDRFALLPAEALRQHLDG